MKRVLRIFSTANWSRVIGAFRQDRRALGLRGAIKLLAAHLLTAIKGNLGLTLYAGEFTIRSRDLLHPLRIRAASSDVYVARQVLVEKEYAQLLAIRDVHFVG